MKISFMFWNCREQALNRIKRAALLKLRNASSTSWQYIYMRMCCRRWTLQSIPGHLNWHLTSHRYTAALQSAQIPHPWPKCNVKLRDRNESYFCSNCKSFSFLHVSLLRSADGCEEAAGPRLLKEEAMSPDRFWHLLQVRLASIIY